MLGKEVPAALVRQLKPEVVVLATGVIPFTPDILGLNQAHVVQTMDVLEGKVAVGDRVVVIGGELVGCETAEFLAEKGKKVTVTRRGPEMAISVGTMRTFFLNRLVAKGVTLLAGVRYKEVTSKGLMVTTKEGKTMPIEADSIVLATGANPNRKLYEELKNEFPELYAIGDCMKPRTIRDAITDGFRIATQI